MLMAPGDRPWLGHGRGATVAWHRERSRTWISLPKREQVCFGVITFLQLLGKALC
jgi:hypothetical protein